MSRLPSFVALFANTQAERPKGMRPDEVQFGMQPFDPRAHGKPTFEALLSFCMQIGQQVTPEATAAMVKELEAKVTGLLRKAGVEANGRGEATAKQKHEIVEVTPENWATVCDPSSSTLCAVGFFTGGADSPTFQAELAVLEAAAVAKARDPYRFVWVNGQCRTAFAESFDVQPSKLPTVVVFSPKKNRMASFVGVYGEKTVSQGRRRCG